MGNCLHLVETMQFIIPPGIKCKIFFTDPRASADQDVQIRYKTLKKVEKLVKLPKL